MVNSYSLSDDSGVMAAAAITHFLFGQAVFSYLNGWSVLIGPGTGLDSTGCKYARDLMGLVAFTYRKLKNQSIPLSTPYAT
ncbi:hypothetical protein SND13_01855 [Escherichia coli]|nr:hypothetical protein [Escherichia coli]